VLTLAPGVILTSYAIMAINQVDRTPDKELRNQVVELSTATQEMDIDENTSTLTPNPIRTFHLLHHYADVFLKRTLPTSEDEQDTPVVNVNKNRNRKLSR
ncbi:5944_t:CDS:2, partial [Rhizophagus irregularis]